MEAKCPNNIQHKEFVTTAYEMHGWKVDKNGNYIETKEECVQVVSGPQKENIWTCSICGAEAILSD